MHCRKSINPADYMRAVLSFSMKLFPASVLLVCRETADVMEAAFTIDHVRIFALGPAMAGLIVPGLCTVFFFL